MDLGLLARGAILGFTVAAAVGPIALLTIRRTLAQGWATGMASGLGVATADAFYGGVAALGLTAIADALVALIRPLGLVGGMLFVLIGGRTALARPASREATPDGASGGLPGAYLSVLGLTLTNPMTILLFAAIVVSIGVRGSAADAALLTCGFFLGSLAWWTILVSVTAAIRTRISSHMLHVVTIVSGALVALFGAIAIVAVLRA